MTRAAEAMSSALYIGLMSGTSLDGVDGVLVELPPDGALRVTAHAHREFPTDLRDELFALNAAGPDELARAALAANGLCRVYAQAVEALLAESGTPASAVRAIGAHGQTVRHRPGAVDGIGYSWQLNNPALLAELAGIDVVADFRSRDVAAGGQGAPLAPGFHRHLFARPDATVAVLNIGGIANITVLDGERTLGFDCGPGNALMDHWCLLHRGQPYDDRGEWAATGRTDTALLAALTSEPYLAAPPPKSTGRDLFNPGWLASRLRSVGEANAPADVQATLAEFTARCAADAVAEHAPGARELIVCGGGALNAHLMLRLGARLPRVQVVASGDRGLPPLQVEAAAFAWLAQCFVERRHANLPSVTGARGARILGALYPG